MRRLPWNPDNELPSNYEYKPVDLSFLDNIISKISKEKSTTYGQLKLFPELYDEQSQKKQEKK